MIRFEPMGDELGIETEGPGENQLVIIPSDRAGSRRARAAAENDWLCAFCHHRLAGERDRLQLGGQSELAFTNPAGVPFLIITFSRVRGCRNEGDPTFADTWFPGYAWTYGVCGQCDRHLGWYYRGASEFVGLIQNRIVRALNVFN